MAWVRLVASDEVLFKRLIAKYWIEIVVVTNGVKSILAEEYMYRVHNESLWAGDLIKLNIGSFRVELNPGDYPDNLDIEMHDWEWACAIFFNGVIFGVLVDRFTTEQKLEEELVNYPELKLLTLYNNIHVEYLSFLNSVKSLQYLSIYADNSLKNLNAISSMQELLFLKLGSCTSLSDISGLDGLTQLTSLDLSSCESLVNLHGLDGLTQLTSLDLGYCVSLSDISGLDGLTQLTSLNLSSCESLVNLHGIEHLTQLTSLDLSSCKRLSDISVLEGLTELTSLNLQSCESLVNLNGIQNLTHLTSLDLSYCISLSNISGLRDLTELTSLNLQSCESLVNLNGIQNLTKLTSLDLIDCYSLSNISGLRDLTELTSLKLSSCQSLVDLNGIQNLTKLTSLTLIRCHSLSNISGLYGLTQLTSLTLIGCDSLLDSLRDLTELTSLNLGSGESLVDLNGIQNLTKLTSLNLSYCKSLIDIHAISGLINLTKLNLSNCDSIRNISPLATLINLKKLEITDTNLPLIAPISHLPNLEILDLGNCHYIQDIWKLQDLPNLRTFEYHDPTVRDLILMRCAARRQDEEYVLEHIVAWIEPLALIAHPAGYGAAIVHCCALLREAQVRAAWLVKIASALKENTSTVESPAALAEMWSLYARVALTCSEPALVQGCFEVALEDFKPEQDIEGILTPVLTALSDIPVQYPLLHAWALPFAERILDSLRGGYARAAAPGAAAFYGGFGQTAQVLSWLEVGTRLQTAQWKDEILLALIGFYCTNGQFSLAAHYSKELQMEESQERAAALLAAGQGTAAQQAGADSDAPPAIPAASAIPMEIPATMMLRIFERNPALEDLIAPRKLAAYKERLQREAVEERTRLLEAFTEELVQKKLLDPADRNEFMQGVARENATKE